MKNCIKKSLTILFILAAVFVAGCASGGGDKFKTWQSERAFAENIQKARDGQKAVTLDDVTYKSEINNAALAAPVNMLSATVGALYLTVVNGTDKMFVYNEGRKIYVGIENEIKAGKTRGEMMKVLSENPEDQAAYYAYIKFARSSDQDKILKTVVLPLIEKLTKEAKKVAIVAQKLQKNPELKKLAGLEALKAGKAIAADAKALETQVSDATSGAVYWKELLNQDKRARKFMKDYPLK